MRIAIVPAGDDLNLLTPAVHSSRPLWWARRRRLVANRHGNRRVPGQTGGMASAQAIGARDGVEALILRHRPLACHLAQRYVRATDQREDLEQVAYLGLVKAAQRFDPGRGTAFTSFAVPTILGELRRHCRDTRWAWHVPRPVQERVQALRRLEDQWRSRTGRPPSAGQAAEALGCTPEEILDARLAAATLAPESLNAPVRSADGTIGEALERLPVEERGFEAAERRETLGRALAGLDERARRAL
jgi:RNA polymerase sigma-B factor